MFHIKGIYHGKEYEVHYEDEKLTGSKEIVEVIREEAKKDHGFLGVMPGALKDRYLEREGSSLSLIKFYVFEKILSEEDDYPPYDKNVEY
jgi:hypothetical protein